jgi:tetratricopeptide (TPR) repeat protein
LTPGLVHFHFARGLDYETLGQYELAIEAFNKAIEPDPGLSKANYHRGNCFAYLGENNKVIGNFTIAIELDPGFSETYFVRGLMNHKLGHYQQAIEDFDQAIALNPREPDYYYHKARCYGLMGKSEEVAICLGQTLNLDAKLYCLLAGIESNFNNVRETPEFQAVMMEYCEDGSNR